MSENFEKENDGILDNPPPKLFDDDDAKDILTVAAKENKKLEKKLAKRQKKQEKKVKYPNKISFFIGLIIVIFAILGMFFTVHYSMDYINKSSDSGSEFAKYNEYLTPIAAVDPDSFDDIASADTEQLLNAAIWYIISQDTTPDTYSYKGGYMLIPSADIEQAYTALFGKETVKNIEHQTIQGYNCTFEFDSTASVYKIPVTTITPVYTPRVTNVEKSGSSLILTVEYLAAESWSRDNEGNFVAPSPDKTCQITLKDMSGSYYIGAVRVISKTVPDAVITVPNIEVEEQTEAETTAEVTTRSIGVPTTLGGRV